MKSSKFIIRVLIVALLISVLPIGLVANADKGKVKENKENIKKVVEAKVELINKEEAIKIAKKKAIAEITDNEDIKESVKKDEIELIKLIKTEDIGVVFKDNMYYIEFSTGFYKYIVHVNSKTGKVAYYNEVLLIENDSNLKKALKSAYNAILDEEDIDYEDIKIVKIRSFLNAKIPYYIFELKTEKFLYEIKVVRENFVVDSFKQSPLKDKNKSDDEDEDDDEDDDENTNLRPNELNQMLREIKKEMINEFKNAKKHASKSDKKLAISDFKANKELLKIAKASLKPGPQNEQGKKQTKPINEIKNLTRNQIEEKAREKINAKGVKLESIELKNDTNPQYYLVKMYNDDYSYELQVHAPTGAVLEYLRVAK